MCVYSGILNLPPIIVCCRQLSLTNPLADGRKSQSRPSANSQHVENFATATKLSWFLSDFVGERNPHFLDADGRNYQLLDVSMPCEVVTISLLVVACWVNIAKSGNAKLESRYRRRNPPSAAAPFLAASCSQSGASRLTSFLVAWLRRVLPLLSSLCRQRFGIFTSVTFCWVFAAIMWASRYQNPSDKYGGGSGWGGGGW